MSGAPSCLRPNGCAVSSGNAVAGSAAIPLTTINGPTGGSVTSALIRLPSHGDALSAWDITSTSTVTVTRSEVGPTGPGPINAQLILTLYDRTQTSLGVTQTTTATIPAVAHYSVPIPCTLLSRVDPSVYFVGATVLVGAGVAGDAVVVGGVVTGLSINERNE